MATSIHYVPRTEPDYTGPSWNNSNEYPSLTSNEFTYDRQQLDSLVMRLEQTLNQTSPLKVSPDCVLALQVVCELEEQAWILLFNMRVYASCLLSVDSENRDARTTLSQLASLTGKLEALVKPVEVFLATAPEAFIDSYLAHPHVKPYEFKLREQRAKAQTLLSEQEESLLARLTTNGPAAFGSLYEQLSGSIRCNYENPQTGQTEQIGLSQAAGLMRDASEDKRRNAWRATQIGWKANEVPVASVLNALAGWRLDLTEQRSAKRRSRGGEPLHFLELPLKDSRIKPETLSAMLSAVHQKIEMPRKATRLMAKALGKAKLDPWDLQAPAPVTASGGTDVDSRVTFDKGYALIREAFDGVHHEMADFADTMKKNRWIEGRSLPHKKTGAYCTGFPKSSSPRVFQTFMGSLHDVRVLAHELGHAFHFWVMKDLPQAQRSYPMTIAESASLFAETAFSETLMAKAKRDGNKADAMSIAWQNAESASALLLNIPARFDFEKSFYERRQQGYVSPEDLSQLTFDAWEKWYGDTLTGYETQFWMTKLHFSISSTSFYNYPYTFGYLFSLGIYAQREKLGEKFWPNYVALLRDTGRMSAEDLAKTYLGADLTSPKFWLESLAIVEKQIAEFESLLEG